MSDPIRWPAPRSVKSEDLPERGEHVLAWDNDFKCWNTACFRGVDHQPPGYVWDHDTYGLTLEDVDFWIPLPGAPLASA
jgi:hypothetical protein